MRRLGGTEENTKRQLFTCLNLNNVSEIQKTAVKTYCVLQTTTETNVHSRLKTDDSSKYPGKGSPVVLCFTDQTSKKTMRRAKIISEFHAPPRWHRRTHKTIALGIPKSKQCFRDPENACQNILCFRDRNENHVQVDYSFNQARFERGR